MTTITRIQRAQEIWAEAKKVVSPTVRMIATLPEPDADQIEAIAGPESIWSPRIDCDVCGKSVEMAVCMAHDVTACAGCVERAMAALSAARETP